MQLLSLQFSVDTRPRLNVYKTSLRHRRRRIDVLLTLKRRRVSTGLESVQLSAICSKVLARKCFVEKVFLKMSQNSQGNTCARVSFLMNLQVEAQTLFRWILSKLLRTPFSTKHLQWLLVLVVFQRCI